MKKIQIPKRFRSFQEMVAHVRKERLAELKARFPPCWVPLFSPSAHSASRLLMGPFIILFLLSVCAVVIFAYDQFVAHFPINPNTISALFLPSFLWFIVYGCCSLLAWRWEDAHPDHPFRYESAREAYRSQRLAPENLFCEALDRWRTFLKGALADEGSDPSSGYRDSAGPTGVRAEVLFQDVDRIQVAAFKQLSVIRMAGGPEDFAPEAERLYSLSLAKLRATSSP